MRAEADQEGCGEVLAGVPLHNDDIADAFEEGCFFERRKYQFFDLLENICHVF
jgi:hypothetical protein